MLGRSVNFGISSLPVEASFGAAALPDFLKNRKPTNRNSLTCYEKGISSELCAERLLSSKGYQIIGRRVKTKYGEIDLLIKKGNDVVAVEVKQRKRLGDARTCISLRQRHRILNALLFVASERDKPFENYRIDVVCFDAVGRFDHIENAFPLDSLVAC
ncbi:MAG: YraN family protein [Alphaproteobacteria bacterium]|nr:YraN family protein [Alphaproteobacteria bacterium]